MINIKDVFFLICIFLMFNSIPRLIQLNFIAGNMGGILTLYPIFIGIIYTIWCQHKNKNIFVHLNKFKKFIFLYVVVNTLSVFIGLCNYPYYNLILNGPIDQVEKLPKVLDILNNLGIIIDEKFLLEIWMIGRVVKNLLVGSLYTFGGAYIIYCWWRKDFLHGYKILNRAIFYSVILITAYGIIDVFYLQGSETAAYLLASINPYIHIIKDKGTWWPPLLWNGQLRSIFAEPSYFGIYAAFAMPFLWYKLIKIQNRKHIAAMAALIMMFTFCLFLTKARTAVALFAGEFFLLIIALLYLRNRLFLKRLLLIASCVVISFISSSIFISTAMEDKQVDINSGIETYLDENLGSLATTNERSNNSRYSIMIANFRIGMDHPILGVGLGLKDAYITEYLPEMSKDNKEINRWKEDQKEKGLLKMGYPNLGEYVNRFSQTGILGLIIFMVPPLFLLKKLFSKISSFSESMDNRLMYSLFTISFIGILAAGIGDSINITYCYWVLLGLGYAMCFGRQESVRLKDE